MYYQINMITEDDGWIAIDTDGMGWTPVKVLAESVCEEVGGVLVQPYEGDAQFIIKGDPYKLVFQYDDVFGTVVILNKMQDKEAVVELLQKHFEKLKSVQL